MSSISAHPDQLPVETTADSESRSTELGDYTVEFGSIRTGFTVGAELLDGLPNSACQCPHWGILLKGEFRVPFIDGRVEVVRAGEAYYMPPGHRFEVVEDCEFVEFSPTRELRETHEVLSRNIQKREQT